MIKHFNTCDVYRQSNYNIYPEQKLLALDRLQSFCRYHTLEYLIDCTALKHLEKNNGGCVFMLHLHFHDLWASGCADIVKKLIEAADGLLSGGKGGCRDYIWFLKQPVNEKCIHAVIIFFGSGESFGKLDMVAGALQDILSAQNFLTDFEIDIPSLIPERRRTLILSHADISDGTMLLDCGFASDFNFS